MLHCKLDALGLGLHLRNRMLRVASCLRRVLFRRLAIRECWRQSSRLQKRLWLRLAVEVLVWLAPRLFSVHSRLGGLQLRLLGLLRLLLLRLLGLLLRLRLLLSLLSLRLLLRLLQLMLMLMLRLMRVLLRLRG